MCSAHGAPADGKSSCELATNNTSVHKECSSDWLSKQSNFLGQKNVISMQPLDRDGGSFKDNHKLDVSFIANLQSISEPFSARADYISADFIKQNPHEIDLKYLNYVRLIIDVPYIEGSFPMISTKPLFNYRLLLDSESDYSSQHVCSNFIGHNQANFIKYGFLTNDQSEQSERDLHIFTLINRFFELCFLLKKKFKRSLGLDKILYLY